MTNLEENSFHSFKNPNFIPVFIPTYHKKFTPEIRCVENATKPNQDSPYGYNVLVLLRGLPGSGKSSIAQALHDTLGAFVCSADDFFVTSHGVFQYDRLQLSEAHNVCQRKAKTLLQEKKTIVVIDNTNITCSEMEPYVKLGLTNGYDILPLETNTTWRMKVAECAQRNKHNVPLNKITQMKKRYEKQNQVIDWINLLRRQLKIPFSQPQIGNMATLNPQSSLPVDNVEVNSSSGSNVLNGNICNGQKDESTTQLNNEPTITDQSVIDDLVTQFPALSLSTIHEMYEVTDKNRDWTIQLLLEIHPDGDTGQSETYFLPELPDASNELISTEDSSGNSESALTSVTPPMEEIPPQHSYNPDGNLYSDITPISLTPEFLMDAQNRFSLQLGLQQIDFENWPPDIIQNWHPPEHVAKIIFASFMSQMGFQPASHIQFDPETYAETLNHEMNTTFESQVSRDTITHDRHRCHSESEVGEKSIVSTGSCAQNNDTVPFLELMHIDLAMSRSIEDQRHMLSEVSSRMKLRLLKEMFPAFEMCHLEEVYVRFNFNTTQLLDYLLRRGHTPKPTVQFDQCKRPWSSSSQRSSDEDNDDDLLTTAFFIRGNKQEITEADLRERLAEERDRKVYLLEKIQDAANKKSLPGVAQFYQNELGTTNKLINALDKRLSNATISNRRPFDGLNKLDIHHLNVRNGIDQVKKRIAEIKNSDNTRQTLTIITGRGVHSLGPARLRPAIKKFLDSKSLNYEEKYDGHFVVSLR